MKPAPSGPIRIVAAGQSERGIKFSADHADFSFALGSGINTPKAFAPFNEKLMAAAEKTGRDVGTYVLFMIIADETDEAALAKWETYRDGVDVDAVSWMAAEGGKDTNAKEGDTARAISLPEGAVNFNMGTLVGSYASVAAMMDEIAEVPGTKGVMLTFDEFVEGVETFGTKIQPLMRSRAHRLAEAA